MKVVDDNLLVLFAQDSRELPSLYLLNVSKVGEFLITVRDDVGIDRVESNFDGLLTSVDEEDSLAQPKPS